LNLGRPLAPAIIPIFLRQQVHIQTPNRKKDFPFYRFCNTNTSLLHINQNSAERENISQVPIMPNLMLAAGIMFCLYTNPNRENLSIYLISFLNRFFHRFCCVNNRFLKVDRCPIKSVHCVAYVSFYCVSYKWQHSFHFVIKICHKFQ